MDQCAPRRTPTSVRADVSLAVISARRCLTPAPGGRVALAGSQVERRAGAAANGVRRRRPLPAGAAAALRRRQPMRQRSVQRRGQQPRRRRLACGVSGRILAGRGARQLIKDAGRHEGVVERHARAPEAPQARRACGVHARQQLPPGPGPARCAAGEVCSAAAAARPSGEGEARDGSRSGAATAE